MTGTKQLQAIPAETLPYEVGYRKPPVQHQFGNGQKINRKGRPKGSKNKQPKFNELVEITLEEAGRDIVVTEGGQRAEISRWRAFMRRLYSDALMGKPHASRLYADLVTNAALEKDRRHEEGLKHVIEFKMGAEKRLEEYKKRGIEPPKFFLHPDQFVLDIRNDTWWIEGPLSEQERDESIAFYEERRNECQRLLKFIQDRLSESERAHSNETDPKLRKRLQRDIDQDRSSIATFKRRSEELLEALKPWGFVETRPLLDEQKPSTDTG
ncbi:MAG: hypothetical protein JJ911_15645 [Rhizobiaceae bacterium]|nr:hypothetical protein [Rhizobiaceae bacterium]